MANEDPFTTMAAKISHNDPVNFGGAAVIVFPPSGVAPTPPIELLILDPKADLAQFIATLKSRLEMIMQEIQTNQRSYGR